MAQRWAEHGLTKSGGTFFTFVLLSFIRHDHPGGPRIPMSVSSSDLARCGLFGAAALLLPTLFHLLHLGHVFMPMYLPLVTLGFFATPMTAAVTSFLTPLLSGAVTGMPPFFPPIAFFMAIELSIMSGLIAMIVGRRPTTPTLAILIPVLILGRVLYVGLVYATSLFLALPAGLIAGLSLLSGWPGIILMIAVIPGLARFRPTGN